MKKVNEKLGSKRRKKSPIKRPLAKLSRLEVDQNDPPKDDEPENNLDPSDVLMVSKEEDVNSLSIRNDGSTIPDDTSFDPNNNEDAIPVFVVSKETEEDTINPFSAVEENSDDELYEEEYQANCYAKDTDGNEYYANDINGDPFYLFDSTSGKQSYACKTSPDNKIKEYPIYVNGKAQYIKTGPHTIFPFDMTSNRPIFSKNAEGHEIYPYDFDTGESYYPTDQHHNEYYARTSNGDEYFLQNSRGELIFASLPTGKEKYPVDRDGNQCYLRREDVEIAANKEIVENRPVTKYYAKKSNGNEFYPRRFRPRNVTTSTW